MRRFVCLCLAAFFCSCLSFGCSFHKETSIERVERLTGFDLPDDMHELYYFQGETFTGVAGQYSVYSLNEEPECVLEYQKGGFTPLSSENQDRILEDLQTNGVPTEYYPDFEKTYSYAYGNEDTYVFYFPEEKRLKIWMWGH